VHLHADELDADERNADERNADERNADELDADELDADELDADETEELSILARTRLVVPFAVLPCAGTHSHRRFIVRVSASSGKSD
jgi:hypothetical protein